MDKAYNHKTVEERIYKEWEEKGYFKPEVNPEGKPYSIILPPPNANGALHFGHAMFTVEDILIRYHRMKGFSALWLPGTDHAGIETQFVFEKKLKQEGKSRLDFDQETLFKMIHEYVEDHRGEIQKELRRLGFSLDWSREKYTLDPDIVKLVQQTFKKMYDDGLVYRNYRLVNYCTFDGTGFSDLEVVYEEKQASLYYIKYGEFTIATVRPETKFRDTALAVNPNDPRYKDKIGKTFEIMGLLGQIQMKVIADPEVNPEFGTGIMKVTPAHDPHDFELGKKHNLPVTPIIGFDGKMDFSWFLEKKNIESKYKERAEKYHGKYVKEVRKLMVEDFKEDGLLIKTDENYKHRIGVCYKCKNVLEPLPLEQWFVRIKPLVEKAIEVVKKGDIKIHPKNFESQYYQWLENLRDWNISRQIVWGIRIPAWKNTKTGEWKITEGEKPEGKEWKQDADTFDTWFSSGQWPYLTLKTTRPGDFEKFYPTSVMETGYDLLRAWVSRMVMLGLYITKEVPFKHVLFHGLVNDPYGKKMSKSKGNVVNALELIDQYGADAMRFALVYGNGTGNDQALSYSKLDASRKFTNKLWNMGRFIDMNRVQSSKFKVQSSLIELNKEAKNENDREMIEKTQNVIKEVSADIEHYNFNLASEKLYEFAWHVFADIYIEDVKNRIDENSYLILYTVYLILLKLLHPFMPFVTEEIYQRLDFGKSLMIEKWPSSA